MYADDLLLAASTIKDLQELIKICLQAFHMLNMVINSKKSSCINIGQNYDTSPITIVTGTVDIKWDFSMRNVGHTLYSGKVARCDFHSSKIHFFAATNGSLGKIGSNSLPM